MFIGTSVMGMMIEGRRGMLAVRFGVGDVL
jgi:hypothetical protein